MPLRREEPEARLAEGATVAAAAKKIGVTEHTYYRWRSEYGGDAGWPGQALSRALC
jgi:transposase-like protein